VHVRYVAYSRTARPKDHLCRGTWCKENCDYYCIDKCPVGALSMGPNPVYESMGDPRWTPDMIISTWDQAENGASPTTRWTRISAPPAAASTSCA